MNYEDIIMRCDAARHAYKVTMQQIADEAHLSRVTTHRQLRGLVSLDIRIVMALLHLCPTLSADWLLLGRGDMFLK